MLKIVLHLLRQSRLDSGLWIVEISPTQLKWHLIFIKKQLTHLLCPSKSFKCQSNWESKITIKIYITSWDPLLIEIINIEFSKILIWRNCKPPSDSLLISLKVLYPIILGKFFKTAFSFSILPSPSKYTLAIHRE